MTIEPHSYPDYPFTPPPPRTELQLPTTRPVVTYILLGLNILIFFGLPATLKLYGMLIPGAALYYGMWWQWLTTGFLHADLAHIAFNMYALHILGRELEKLFGMQRFIAVYFLSLLGGSVLVTLLSPLNQPTLGASGAILGLMGALAAYFVQHKDILLNGRSQLRHILTTVLINLGIGLLPGISLWGHLGGFLAGLGAGAALLPRYRLLEYPQLHMERKSLSPHHYALTMLIFVVEVALLGLAFIIRRG